MQGELISLLPLFKIGELLIDSNCCLLAFNLRSTSGSTLMRVALFLIPSVFMAEVLKDRLWFLFTPAGEKRLYLGKLVVTFRLSVIKFMLSDRLFGTNCCFFLSNFRDDLFIFPTFFIYISVLFSFFVDWTKVPF